jgi:predicted AAA+ superfamily ATPase
VEGFLAKLRLLCYKNSGIFICKTAAREIMQKIYERWQKKIIEEAIKTRRIILLLGARQCGKTTLCKAISSNNTIYRTLDDETLLNAAQSDPGGFVKLDSSNMLIIDEIQREPKLLLAIKKMVDENNRPGQYLLTGSSNIQSLPNVKESLAGRVRKIRLRPISQGEILGKLPNFINNAFNETFSISKSNYDKDSIIKLAFRGGFPESIRLDEKDRKQWHKDYLEALLERDLKDITNIKRKDAMSDLVSVMASWSSKFIDISAICSKLSIQRPTVESYINALESLYIIERLRPWIKTDYERVGKQDKLFVTDSGLMTSILGWQKDQIKFDSDKVGKLIETFVFNELSTQVEANNNEYSLFHYRDREKREIDYLIEREDGSLLGIEVKSGSTVDNKSFKHLKWFKENIAKEKHFIGLVLYTGENTLSFGNNMWAISINNLWD